VTKPAKYATKSIRLTPEEAQDLAQLVEDHAASESALMRQWVLWSMRQFRIEQVVAAYQRDEVDLREGARMAGIPIGVFVDELSARHVTILRDPVIFQRELEDLMETFGSAEGRAVVREVLASREGASPRRR
jgi:hypothetical protein